MTSTKWTVAGQGAGNWTIAQTYDKADRISSLTYPDGETVTYEYSPRTGLPVSLDTDDGDIIVSAATYTETGQPTAQVWGSGSSDIYVSWDYKADSQRLWKIRADASSAAGYGLAFLRYDYDKSGDVTQLKDLKNSGQVQCFFYDDLYRLTVAFTSNDDPGTTSDCGDGFDAVGSGPYHYGWDIDPLGNIDSVTDVVASTTGNYTYSQSVPGSMPPPPCPVSVPMVMTATGTRRAAPTVTR